jgi:hypothetical protein
MGEKERKNYQWLNKVVKSLALKISNWPRSAQ